MVGEIIRDYIEDGGKKLVVPGFGTFMRKESGEVIFVELLRRDDGVLRELVEDFGHYSEVEAMVMIDRFIFETKTEIELSGSSAIEYFGTMVLDDKGVYGFQYSPRPKLTLETAVQNELFEIVKDAKKLAGERFEPEIAQPEPEVAEPVEDYVETDETRSEKLEPIGRGSKKPVRIRVIKPIKIVFEEIDKDDVHPAREMAKTPDAKPHGKTSKWLVALVAMVMTIAAAAVAYGVWIWTFSR